MALRRKNLLEAFQTADRPAGSASDPASGPGQAPTTAGTRRLPALPRGLIAVVGLGLAFAFGYVLGRNLPAEARAGETGAPPVERPATRTQPPRTPPSSTPSPAAPAPGVDPKSERIEDSALFDPQNLYTVVAVAYSTSAEDLAWASVDHLREHGLAAFPPVLSGKLIVVLVGAAKTSAELAETEAAVRALVRDGEKPYLEAYRQRIDKLIPRPKKEE
jgi:hypothetical protein